MAARLVGSGTLFVPDERIAAGSVIVWTRAGPVFRGPRYGGESESAFGLTH